MNSSCNNNRILIVLHHNLQFYSMLHPPCGFLDRACLVMLVEGFRRVWTIHRQRLIMISASAGLWLVLCHRPSLLMVIGQRIRKILRRHELIKVCTFFVVATVVLHVSEPYSRTGLTLLLKILILVRSLELQTFFNCRETALALPILALTSASVSPWVSTTLPR